MMDYSESDLELALQLQNQFNEELKFHNKLNAPNKDIPQKKKPDESSKKLSISLVDPSWELIDPNPDIYTLFQIYNRQFFFGKLDSVVVKWSKTMTLCAGICRYEGNAGMCSVGLSAPLLKLRPRKDLVETLLHEMIHAYLFVTHNNRDRDGHGPIFHEHMYRINRIAGTSITVYHRFHNEVAVYKQHIWKCNGPCQHRHPYYGLLKRSMNRAPSKHDPWWAEHQSTCGGTYIKIKEPENYKSKKRKAESKTPSSKEDIRKFLKKADNKAPSSSSTGSTSSSGVASVSNPGGVTVSSVKVNGASSANVHKINTSNKNGRRTNVTGGSAKQKGSGTLVKSGNSSSTVTVRNKTGIAAAVSDTNSAQIGSNSTLTAVGSNTRVGDVGGPISSATEAASANTLVNFVPFSGKGKSLGSRPVLDRAKKVNPVKTHSPCKDDSSNLDNSVILIDDDDDLYNEPKEDSSSVMKPLYPCPICQKMFSASEVNIHAETHFK